MDWTYNEALREDIVNRVRTRFGNREGIHLSDLTLCLRKPYFRKKGLSPSISDEQVLLYISGFGLQGQLFPLNGETYSLDDIKCTPDYIGPNKELIEIKSTRASSAKFHLEDMAHWLMQVVGYMKVIGVLEADLAVFFITGNYHPPFPSLDVWTLKASKSEVEANWREILKRKAVLEKALKDDKAPLTEWTQTWEYRYCENQKLCPDCPGAKRR